MEMCITLCITGERVTQTMQPELMAEVLNII